MKKLAFLFVALFTLMGCESEAFVYIGGKQPVPPSTPPGQDFFDLVYSITVIKDKEHEDQNKNHGVNEGKRCQKTRPAPPLPERIAKQASKNLRMQAACYQNVLRGIYDGSVGFVGDVCTHIASRVLNPSEIKTDLENAWALFDRLGGKAVEALLAPEVVASRFGDQCMRAVDSYTKLSELELMKANMDFCRAVGKIGVGAAGGNLLASAIKGGATSAAADQFVSLFGNQMKSELAGTSGGGVTLPPSTGMFYDMRGEIPPQYQKGIPVTYAQQVSSGNTVYPFNPQTMQGMVALNATVDTITHGLAKRGLGNLPNFQNAVEQIFEVYVDNVSPQISKLALLSPRPAALRTNSYLNGFDAAHVAMRGEAVCAESSIMFASALAKLGIPNARVATGVVTNPISGFYGGHAWVEVGDRVYDVGNQFWTSKSSYYEHFKVIPGLGPFEVVRRAP